MSASLSQVAGTVSVAKSRQGLGTGCITRTKEAVGNDSPHCRHTEEAHQAAAFYDQAIQE
jgi:hypothetical protein